MPAACVKKLAKHAIAIARSDAPMFRSLRESNMMLSWRGTTAGARIVGSDFGELLILLLRGDPEITMGASPETAFNEERIQLDQRLDCDKRRAYPHTGACSRIQHPLCQNNDHARCRLDVNDSAAGTLLTVLAWNTATVQRMPAVIDLDFLPDMGRMNRRLQLDAGTGCSPDQKLVASAPPLAIPSSKAAS
jgi:hypothetical protein